MGIHLEDVSLPLLRMYTTGVTLVTGRAAARRDIPAVLALVAEGRLDPSIITHAIADWQDSPKAWLDHRAKLVLIR